MAHIHPPGWRELSVTGAAQREIDTLDWLEKLIWTAVAEEANKKNIEDIGFGKGYVAAAEEWRNLLSGLEVLRADKGMGMRRSACSRAGSAHGV